MTGAGRARRTHEAMAAPPVALPRVARARDRRRVGGPRPTRRRSSAAGLIVELDAHLPPPGRRGSSAPTTWPGRSHRARPAARRDARPPVARRRRAGSRADRRGVDRCPRRRPAHPPPLRRPAAPGAADLRRRRRRPRSGRAPSGRWPDRQARPAHPSDTDVGRHHAVTRPVELLREIVAHYRHADVVYGSLGVRGRAVARAGGPVLRPVGNRQDARCRDHRRRARASTCSSSTSPPSSASTSARPRRTSTGSSTRPAPATSCCSSTKRTRCSASARR